LFDVDTAGSFEVIVLPRTAQMKMSLTAGQMCG